jgi:hypothetical protein
MKKEFFGIVGMLIVNPNNSAVQTNLEDARKARGH